MPYIFAENISVLVIHFQSDIEREREREMGADWGPVVVAIVLFILLSPGLLFQLPARKRGIEFGNMYTSGISILVHSVLFS